MTLTIPRGQRPRQPPLARSLPHDVQPLLSATGELMTDPTPLPPFVDLHNHLVPGVDDGAASVAESLDALRSLYAEGVRTLVATPHLLLPHLATDAAISRELDCQRRAFDRLAQAVAREADLPTIALGQEIWAPDAAAMRRVAARRDVGLAGSRTLLVEFGFELRGSHDRGDRRRGSGGMENRDRSPRAISLPDGARAAGAHAPVA